MLLCLWFVVIPPTVVSVPFFSINHLKKMFKIKGRFEEQKMGVQDTKIKHDREFYDALKTQMIMKE